MHREVKNIETSEITIANTVKKIFDKAIKDLSNDNNHPHNIVNAAIDQVSWLDNNDHDHHIDKQYLLDVMHSIRMVKTLDFENVHTLVHGRSYNHRDTLDDDDKRETACITLFSERQEFLAKLGISERIIIQSLLQSCIDYGVTICANPKILASLFINAVNRSYGLRVYSSSD